MSNYRAFLLGSVCLGLVSAETAAADGRLSAQELSRSLASGKAAASAAKPFIVASNPQEEGKQETKDEAKSEAAAAPGDDAAKPAEAAPAATAEAESPATPPGITDFYGDTSERESMPFRTEATMNPDYEVADAPASPEAPSATAPAEAPAGEAPAAAAAATAEPELPMTPPGTTDFYGDTSARETMPFRAEATMNPDYDSTPVPPPAEAAAAATTEPELPMTPPGVTDFYGDTSARETMPFRADATMNPDYAKPPTAAAASPATQQAVEACRDALNAEAQSGKITFATSSWDIAPESFKTLDKIAKIAKDCNAGFIIEVGGHTDNVGKPASNKTISELRAKSVVKYLTKAGVDAAKLKAVGYGQDKPVGDNGTPDGRRQNRRIEFLVSAS